MADMHTYKLRYRVIIDDNTLDRPVMEIREARIDADNFRSAYMQADKILDKAREDTDFTAIDVISLSRQYS